MAVVKVFETYCQLDEEYNQDVIWNLDLELSYDVQGAQFSPAYRAHQWDGKKRLLTKRLHFPPGLLTRVQEFYQIRGLSLGIQDLRPAKSILPSMDILPQLAKLGKSPYPYQLEMLEAAKNNERGIIRAATGAGKTNCTALMTAHFGKKTIIHVIGKDLLHQTHQFFSKVFQDKIGIIGDGLCEIHDINIASVWTLGQALDVTVQKNQLDEGDDNEKKISRDKYQQVRDLLKETKVHIFDECHLAACETIQSISRHINPDHIYGMSASPYRDDNADLLIECVFGRKIIDISASYLIERGYLVKPSIRFLKMPGANPKEKHYPTIYKDYVANYDLRNSKAVEGASRLVEQGFKPLVLFSNVAHGKELYERIKKNLKCGLLSGKDSSEKRDQVKKDLEEGKISCIIASKIFDIGVDVPALSGLINCSAGKSSVRALQRIGRVIRKYPGKTQAAVLEFADTAPYLRDHARTRFDIYSSEPGFEVSWPKT